ncbi:MAG: hypothetical protein ACI9LE_002278 [Paraglaciecola sp.]
MKNGDVSAKYYRLMGGQNVPEIITKTTRNFNNQFEIPTLFYVVCTLYISFGIESFLALVFDWLFTILRIVHSYIHITYNHVMHSMLTFFAAFICVMVLWVNLLLQKIQAIQAGQITVGYLLIRRLFWPTIFSPLFGLWYKI